ncbi:MAG: hypothetical protein ABFD69_10040 [Candidatus Sumerlaeia bacterium]
MLAPAGGPRTVDQKLAVGLKTQESLDRRARYVTSIERTIRIQARRDVRIDSAVQHDFAIRLQNHFRNSEYIRDIGTGRMK